MWLRHAPGWRLCYQPFTTNGHWLEPACVTETNGGTVAGEPNRRDVKALRIQLTPPGPA
jgi:hypothetical protein